MVKGIVLFLCLAAAIAVAYMANKKRGKDARGKQRALNCFAVVLAACLLCGCATGGRVVATDEPVVSSQVSLARIQAANDFIGDTLRYAAREVDAIRQLALAGERGIDAALEALDRYDEFVQGLIERIRQLERELNQGTTENSDTQ